MSPSAFAVLFEDPGGDVLFTNKQFRPINAKLNLGDALILAEAFARKRDIPLAKFEPPTFFFSCKLESGCIWVIEYFTKSGHTVPIAINDGTRHADFLMDLTSGWPPN